MRSTIAHTQLVIITLLTIAFLWATMPGPAHAQRADVCRLITLPPSSSPPLKPNVLVPLAPNLGRHVA